MTTIETGFFPSAPGYDEAVELDRLDRLARFRERYVFTDPDLIYLDGNSLGRLPTRAGEIARRVVQHEWGDRLIRSWNEGWWDLQQTLGDRLSPLVGAAPGEVIISDSTSVNLFKLATAALEARPGRLKVVTDDMNFPTDIYVLQGVAEAHGARVEIVPSQSSGDPLALLEDAIDETTALVSLSHTAFKSGYLYDLQAVTDMAHRSGAMILWDLSHSVGVMPIDLGNAGADLAVGCTYKYLNGGPGSPAFLYVRSDLQERLTNPITAWWGHAEPFAFDLEFRPIEGIRRFHTGTMPVVALAAIEAGVDDVIEAGLPSIRAKSVALCEYLLGQWETHLALIGFAIASPRDPERRGAHVGLSHPEAWPITRAMVEAAKVIPDFRTPDTIRLGLAPLYTSFLDIHTAVQRIRLVVETGVYRDYTGVDLTVT